MKPARREEFDAILEEEIAALPEAIRAALEETPVVVLDRPTPQMLKDLGINPGDEEEALSMCGLHTGVPLTERSLGQEDAAFEHIHLFRDGIVDLAGGWHGPKALEEIRREIRVTLLHEIGHHFGLGEQALSDLGYE